MRACVHARVRYLHASWRLVHEGCRAGVQQPARRHKGALLQHAAILSPPPNPYPSYNNPSSSSGLSSLQDDAMLTMALKAAGNKGMLAGT